VRDAGRSLLRISRSAPRIPVCGSSLHTACVAHLIDLRRPARLCGRKKLPFAGYSVVKELTLKLPALSFSAFSRWRPLARQLLSKLCRGNDPLAHFTRGAPQPHSVPFAHLSGLAGSVSARPIFQSYESALAPCKLDRILINSPRLVYQPKLVRWRLTSPSPAFMSEGWRIPGSNR
jgi:hypothetical protein